MLSLDEVWSPPLYEGGTEKLRSYVILMGFLLLSGKRNAIEVNEKDSWSWLFMKNSPFPCKSMRQHVNIEHFWALIATYKIGLVPRDLRLTKKELFAALQKLFSAQAKNRFAKTAQSSYKTNLIQAFKKLSECVLAKDFLCFGFARKIARKILHFTRSCQG